MAKRIRLLDIANRLGISKVSVSKALRDHPDISRETRALVRKTAAEMGYTPNLLARSLSSQRSTTLGVVVPKIAHTFFASVIDAVQDEATRSGYGIVLAVSNEMAALERQHIDRLLAMRVDGLLVSVSKEAPDLEVYRRVREMQVPLVFFDREIRGLGFNSVTVDDRAGAERAVEMLIEQGMRRIAHIAGSQEVEIGRERRAGYESALRKHGIELAPEWIVEGGFDEWHGRAAVPLLLASGGLPDAIFTVSFPVALGVRAGLAEHAPDQYERIRIASFCEEDQRHFYSFPHVCIRQPAREMGHRAVRMLLDLIDEDRQEEVTSVVLHTRVVSCSDASSTSLSASSDETKISHDAPRAESYG